MTPEGAGIRNPAFDVTPSNYISAIITERGVIRAPYREGFREVQGGSGRFREVQGGSGRFGEV
jgi:methylthioribose-1-phosphate isomerase